MRGSCKTTAIHKYYVEPACVAWWSGILQPNRRSNTVEFLNFFSEAANAVNFETRRPALQVGDIIVMDNLGVHHYGGGEALEEFLADMGIELIYTPAYSPDLNPVELCFNKLKTKLNFRFNNYYTLVLMWHVRWP